MKTVDPNRQPDLGGLVDAVLADDSWRDLSSDLKGRALATLAQARRRRHLRNRVGQAALAITLLGSLAWWFHSPASNRGRATLASNSAAPTAAADDRFITESQMLAMFPPGSCVVAEVDGRKQLVFLDPLVAQDGFVVEKK
jgi:hypothetical protein